MNLSSRGPLRLGKRIYLYIRLVGGAQYVLHVVVSNSVECRGSGLRKCQGRLSLNEALSTENLRRPRGSAMCNKTFCLEEYERKGLPYMVQVLSHCHI